MSGLRAPIDKRWSPRESSTLLTLVLGVVDRCARPLAALGIDPLALREILRVKLLLDLRGTPAGVATPAAPRRAARRSADAPAAGVEPAVAPRGGSFLNVGLVLILTSAWLAGMLPAIVGLLHPPPQVWMAFVSGLTMAFVAFLVFAQSAAWIMDTTDIGVLASRPVSDRTLFAARMAHIGIYVALIALALMFWPLALGSIAYPWWAVLGLVPVTVGLSAILAVGLVGGGFALLLRLAGPRHFQRVTLWAQIVLSSLAMGGFQILMGSARRSPMLRDLPEAAWFRALLPPLHFGGLFAWALGERSDANLLLAGLALLLPWIVIGLGLLLASRHFIAGLSGALQPVARRSAGWSRGLLARTGRRLLLGDEERAGYEFTLAMSHRDRLFIRTAWPMLSGMLLLSIGMVVSSRDSSEAFALRAWSPFALYAFALSVPGVLEVARICETPDARWLFRALPVRDPRQLLRGGILALVFGTMLPLMLVAGLVILALAGFDGLPDVLLALEFVTVIVLLAARRMELHLPFSAPMRSNEFNMTNLALIFAMLGLAGVAAGAHAALRLLVPGDGRLGVWLGVGLAAWLVVRSWRALDRVQLLDSETGGLWKPPVSFAVPPAAGAATSPPDGRFPD